MTDELTRINAAIAQAKSDRPGLSETTDWIYTEK